MTLALALLLAAAPDIADGFERGLCVGSCPRAPWAIAQQQNGSVTVTRAPGRAGLALRADTGPKRGGAVAKADLVARIAPVQAGGQITVTFDLLLPAGTPRDSLQLLDIECATCGEGGNPGVRLYLRRGRLRVDRSKIGIRHAWTNEAAPTLSADRWHRIAARFDIGDDRGGGVQVTLDGRTVLSERGATVAALPRLAADRVQIGITANSNAVPATAWFDNVRIVTRR